MGIAHVAMGPKRTRRPPEPTAPETRTVQACGYDLAVDFYGDSAAPLVLLLHGIPGWRGSWRPLGRLLAPHAHVVAPDLLGFGESDRAPAAHAAEHAEVIAALIEQLGRGPVHLVGFDFGGPTAVLVHAKAPDLVASLTLVATNVLTDTPIPPFLQVIRIPMLGTLFSRVLFSRPGLTAMWPVAVARHDRFGLSDYWEMLRFPEGVASTRRVFQVSLRDLPGLYSPVQAALASIRVPCAVVWGDRDPFFPVCVGERTAAQVPGASFTVVPACGHFVPAEDPQALSEVLIAILRGHSGSVGTVLMSR